MAGKSIDATVEELRAGNEVSFADLNHVCTHYFGKPRIKCHHIFSTPWPGDPRINIQSSKGKAKRYQARQVLAALDKLAEMVLAQQKQQAQTESEEKKSKKKKK